VRGCGAYRGGAPPWSCSSSNESTLRLSVTRPKASNHSICFSRRFKGAIKYFFPDRQSLTMVYWSFQGQQAVILFFCSRLWKTGSVEDLFFSKTNFLLVLAFIPQRLDYIFLTINRQRLPPVRHIGALLSMTSKPKCLISAIPSRVICSGHHNANALCPAKVSRTLLW
jgi:hypothetical protein